MVAWAALVLLCALVLTEERKLNKCCPENQILVLSRREMHCIDSNGYPGSSEHKRKYAYGNKTQQGNLRELKIAYKERQYCDTTEATVFNRSDINITQNGFLELRGFASREFYIRPSAYCADWVYVVGKDEAAHMYFVCPCLHSTCVRTCCNQSYQFLDSERELQCTNYTRRALSPSHSAQRENITLTSYHFSRKVNATLVCTPDPGADLQAPAEIRYWNMVKGRMLSRHNGDDFSPLRGDEFCIGIATVQRTHYVIVRCRKERWRDDPFYFLSPVLSAVLLALTWLVYEALPDSRGNKSRVIIRHIVCTLITEVTRAMSRHDRTQVTELEYLSVYGEQFFYIAGSLWINVLCVELVTTFRLYRAPQAPTTKPGRKFQYYSVYVWATSSLVTVTSYSVRSYITVSDVTRFWIVNGGIFFIIGPINAVLLFYIIVKIIQRQRETTAVKNRLASSRSIFNRYRTLLVHLNLLLLMGPPTLAASILFIAEGLTYNFERMCDAMHLLRSASILLFVLMKPKVLLLFGDALELVRAPCRERNRDGQDAVLTEDESTL